MPAGRLTERLVDLAMPLMFVVVSCGPVVVVRDGHRVFNPAYTFALDWHDRDVWQKPEDVMSVLDVVEGDVVADIGAGSGYFSEWLSRRVGPSGRVYATDVQDAMLSTLRRRVVDRGLTNVEVVRATFDDPTLPDACCKVVLFSSVYKEIDGRVAYMRKVTHALEPGGRVAILEYRPDAAGPGPPPELRLDARQVIDELGTAGFALVARHEFIDRQYLLVFAPANDAARRPALPERR